MVSGRPGRLRDVAAWAGQRVSFARLQRLGLQTQALKSALAAALAWAIGAYVPWGPAQPYLAPLTAVLTVQATIAESMQGAFQRILGVAAGVGIAALASHSVGASPLTIALLVLVGQALGALLGLTLVGTSQVIVSALLVLTVGEATESGWLYGWGRIAETIVGAGVGIAVNGLVVPPSYLGDASRAWQTLAADLADQIDALASDLTTGLTSEQARAALERARAASSRLDAAMAALDQAERSLRFNYFGRAQRRAVARYRRAVETLEHAAIQLRGISRVLADLLRSSGADPFYSRTAAVSHWLAADALGGPLGRRLEAAGNVLAVFASTIDGDASAAADTDVALAHARAAALQTRQAVLDAARAQVPILEPNVLIALGAILADLDRMVNDLARAAIDRANHDRRADDDDPGAEAPPVV